MSLTRPSQSSTENARSPRLSCSPDRHIDPSIYDEPRKLRPKNFMGPFHSEHAVMGVKFLDPDPLKKRERELKRRDRIVSNARALLDELNGKKRKEPSPEPEPPKEEVPVVEEKKAEEEPKKEEEPPKEEAPPPPKEPTPPPEEEQKMEETTERTDEVKQEEPLPPTEAVAHEEEAPPPPPPAAPEKPKLRSYEGFMEKFAVGKSSFGAKNWKKRYFKLSDGEGKLTYHEASHTKALSDTIEVAAKDTRLITRPSTSTHAEVADSGTDIVLIFFDKDAPTEERRLLMRCENASEHDKWCEALSSHCSKVNEAADSPQP